MKIPADQSCPLCSSVHNYTAGQAITHQAATYARLARLTKDLTPRQLAFRPAPHKWSIKELLCHLCDTEIVYSFRYRKVLSEGYPFLSSFDQNLWAKEMIYDKQDARTILETFKLLRLNNVAVMRSLTGRKWGRIGMHEQFGRISFRQMVAHLADHDRKHVQQITTIRTLLKA